MRPPSGAHAGEVVRTAATLAGAAVSRVASPPGTGTEYSSLKVLRVPRSRSLSKARRAASGDHEGYWSDEQRPRLASSADGLVTARAPEPSASATQITTGRQVVVVAPVAGAAKARREPFGDHAGFVPVGMRSRQAVALPSA